MKKHAVLTADLMVDDVMRRWPSAIRAFLDFRMRCVGCPIAAFHSVDEACDEHSIDAAAFLSKLRDMAKAAAEAAA
jgi:hybrid cluster-associated redox disulfide protein